MYTTEELKQELDFFKRFNAHYSIQAGKATCKVSDASLEMLYMAMSASLVMDYSEDGFFEDFVITDKSISGKNESMIDAYAFMDSDNSQVKHLHVFQYKLYESYEKAASPIDLLNLATCVSNNFIHPVLLEESKETTNSALEEIKDKFNSFLEGRRGRKVIVSCHLITSAKGVIKGTSKDITEVKNRFLSDKQIYGFSVEVYGLSDILDLSRDGKIKVDEETIDIVVDNSVNAYRLEDNTSRSSMGLPQKVIIGMCNVNEFIRLQNKYHYNQLYAENIRLYLGDRGVVNKDIIRTITSTESMWFPYMNNGISIICDKMEIGSVLATRKSVTLTLHNMQIINGCQTVNALYSAKYGEDTKDNFRPSNVLVRIYEIDPSQSDFKTNIIRATNNQNAVKSYSLMANDPIQLRISEVLKMMDVLYDRKGEGRMAKKETKVISMVGATLSYRAVFNFQARALRSGLGASRLFQKAEYEKVFNPSFLEEGNERQLVRRCIQLLVATITLDLVRDFIESHAEKYIAQLPIVKKSTYYVGGYLYAKHHQDFDSLLNKMTDVLVEGNISKIKGCDFIEEIESLVKDKIEDTMNAFVDFNKQFTPDDAKDIDNMLKSQKFGEAYENEINKLKS